MFTLELGLAPEGELSPPFYSRFLAGMKQYLGLDYGLPPVERSRVNIGARTDASFID